uniref:Uncharacterized protein n=1 Tax=Craspedostauros australis TaxID=1486917 RepID=A0A7S0F761_9STRA|mmetsp:Transcript_9250/g.24988  ORF Transcript_9250/g.24988 Transcript_9250/m.24988 type:complete len:362 (+) Transcript_9250:57-1142(+)
MNSIPLDHTLPLSPSCPRSVVIYDSIDADGRFLLHTFASQVLKSTTKRSTKQRVLWVSGSPTTPAQIATGLRKIGCDAATSYLRRCGSAVRSSRTSHDDDSQETFQIRSLAAEIAEWMAQQHDIPANDDTPGNTDAPDIPKWDAEDFMKHVYRDVKRWSQNQSVDPSTMNDNDGDGNDADEGVRDYPNWLIIDDCTALANLVGSRLTFQFLQSIVAHATKTRTAPFGVLIRCSADVDQRLARQQEKENSGSSNATTLNLGWIGGGGPTHPDITNTTSRLRSILCWERAVSEIVDGVIDVAALASGYSREAHGRLVFTEVPGGRGWNVSNEANDSSSNRLQVINYCLTDSGVRAIRLRGATN